MCREANPEMKTKRFALAEKKVVENVETYESSLLALNWKSFCCCHTLFSFLSQRKAAAASESGVVNFSIFSLICLPSKVAWLAVSRGCGGTSELRASRTRSLCRTVYANIIKISQTFKNRKRWLICQQIWATEERRHCWRFSSSTFSSIIRWGVIKLPFSQMEIWMMGMSWGRKLCARETNSNFRQRFNPQPTTKKHMRKLSKFPISIFHVEQ